MIHSMVCCLGSTSRIPSTRRRQMDKRVRIMGLTVSPVPQHAPEKLYAKA